MKKEPYSINISAKRIRLYFWIGIIVVLCCRPNLTPAAFTNETATLFPTSGVQVEGYWTCWGDYNNDGYVDFSDFGRVFKNNGGTGFTWVGYFGDIWGDYDNDGKLDGYRWWSNVPQLYRNQSFLTTTAFDNPITMPDLPAGPLTSSGTTMGACWADFNGDGYLDVFVGGANPGAVNYHDVVLINQNATSFTSSTLGATAKYTKGVTACDWDEDGDMDIYVSIYDLVTANRLWRNNGSAVFTDVAATHNARNTDPGWSGSWAGGAAWGDIDNDGDFDLFAGNFSHDDFRGDQPESRFLENRGSSFDWAFTDKGQSGVAWVESFISPTLGDFDNDGDLDLFFTAVYGGDFCQLYQNDSVGSSWVFTNVTAIEGLSGIGPTSQAAWADFDNDGDLDLITQQKIFVNDASTNGNHWLRVDLRGNGSTVNRAAIGAQVRISAAGLGTLTRQVEAGTGQGNQNELTLHFGLGSTSDLVTLEITWPDGLTQMVNTVVDRRLTVDQGITPTPQDCAEVLLSGLGMELDFDKDCYIGVGDLNLILTDWLRCNDPVNPNCEQITLDNPLCGPGGSDFVEDFEGWVDADLEIAPWGYAVAPNGTIESPQGTGNSSAAVVELGYNKWTWFEPDEIDQFVAGTLEFDFNLDSWYTPGINHYQLEIHLYVFDDDIPASLMNWAIASRAGVGDSNGVDLYDPFQDEVLLTDFMIREDPWVNFKIVFNCTTDIYDLYVDNVLTLDNQPFSAAANELNRVAWSNPVGYYAQIDNVKLSDRIHIISGNAGIGGVSLIGFPDCPVITKVDGSYSASVPSSWSGTVTPLPPGGFVFSPAQRTYTTVAADHSNNNYALLSFDCDAIWGMGEGLQADVSQDCYVNLTDAAILSGVWMNCNDPEDVACE